MAESNTGNDAAVILRRALSRWDEEGGAAAAVPHELHKDVPEMTNAELVHLRIRVIALENMMIAVLTEGSDRQREIAREMAECISPRPGYTQHPLTIQAAKHMTDLVDRAVHFKSAQNR